jgi:hypothetical protein
LVISTFTLYVAQCFIFELDTVVGAMYLDGGLLPCQRLIAFTLFHDYPTLQETWMNYQPHPLQVSNVDHKLTVSNGHIVVPSFPSISRPIHIN